MSARETTEAIMRSLRKRHDRPRNGNSRAWVFAEEVRVGTGWLSNPLEQDMPIEVALGREQSIDAFALHTWGSKRYRRVAYEVKATRSDLRRELEKPHKQAAALALSNLFYLVAPSHVTKPFRDDLPEEWGIMHFQPESGRTTIYRRAPWRDTPLPPYSFMLSLSRNLQQAVGVSG